MVAVAVVGMLMLSGRIDWRRGARVVAGCFILFGAPTIATGLQGLAGEAPVADTNPVPVAIVLPPYVARSSQPSGGYDPYAGASVPIQ